MKINQISNNQADTSRIVDDLVDQISNVQKDIDVINGQISGIDQDLEDKVSKTDNSPQTIPSIISNEAVIHDLTASGDTTLVNLTSENLSADNITADNVTSESASIQSLTSETINTTEINSSTGNIAHNLEVGGKLTALEAETDTLKVNDTLIADKAEIDEETVETSNINNLSGTTATINDLTVNNLTVNDNLLNIQNIELENLDATSITSDDSDLGHIIYADKVMGDAHHYSPTPALGNTDRYLIELPSFTGTFYLVWKDGDVKKWSAVVIGNGHDYDITWSSAESDNIFVTNLFNWHRKLFIANVANGDLYYTYDTTEEPAEVKVYFNYDSWPYSRPLEVLCDETEQFEALRAAGWVGFGIHVYPRLDGSGSGGIHFKGSCTLAELPEITDSDEGDVWNITDYGYTDSRFVEGEGAPINVGDDVVLVKVKIDEDSYILQWDKFAAGVNYENFVAERITATCSLTSCGPLEVHGISTLHDNVTACSNVSVTGTLGVAGATTLGSTLEVCGNTTLNGNADIIGCTTTHNVCTCGNTSIDGCLLVKGNIRGNCSLSINKTATVCELYVCCDALVNRDLTVNNDIYGRNDLDITGNSLICGNNTVCGNSNICGNETIAGDLCVCGCTYLNDINARNLSVSDALTVGGEATFSDDVAIHGDLYVTGTTTTTTESQVSTSGDYIVTRNNNPTALGAGKYSGLAVNNYASNKIATITADTNGTWRISDSATETSTIYTNISNFENKYYSGLTTTETTGPIGILADVDADELASVVKYNNAYYHKAGNDWYGPVTLVSNALDIGSIVTDAATITALNGLDKSDLIYYRSVTDKTIDASTNQPLLTRDEKANITNNRLLKWDATNTRAVDSNVSVATANNETTVTADYFCGNLCGTACCALNSTCFNGCTYSCACADFRSGLTGPIKVYCNTTCKCSISDACDLKLCANAFNANATISTTTYPGACCIGTVTVSNSTSNSYIPVALCTGATSIGKSNTCALTFNPATGVLCAKCFCGAGTVTMCDSTSSSTVPLALCTGDTSVGKSTCCSLSFIPTTGVLFANGFCGYNAKVDVYGSNSSYSYHSCLEPTKLTVQCIYYTGSSSCITYTTTITPTYVKSSCFCGTATCANCATCADYADRANIANVRVGAPATICSGDIWISA